MGVTCRSKGGQNDFSKKISGPLGLLKQVVEGYFEPSLTHISPCKSPKSLEMGNFGTGGAVQGGSRGNAGREGLSLKRAKRARKGFGEYSGGV